MEVTCQVLWGKVLLILPCIVENNYSTHLPRIVQKIVFNSIKISII